jgi:hypothetical protein
MSRMKFPPVDNHCFPATLISFSWCFFCLMHEISFS